MAAHQTSACTQGGETCPEPSPTTHLGSLSPRHGLHRSSMEMLQEVTLVQLEVPI